MAITKIVFNTPGGGAIQFKNSAGVNVNFVSSGFTIKPVVRLGDVSSHGGTMTTATGTPLKADGITVCKNGDHHTCPITGHGTTTVTSTTTLLKAGGDFVLRTGDQAGCGAVLIQGSPTLKSS